MYVVHVRCLATSSHEPECVFDVPYTAFHKDATCCHVIYILCPMDGLIFRTKERQSHRRVDDAGCVLWCCAGADPTAKDRWGNTPFDDAVRGDFSHLQEILSEHLSFEVEGGDA